MGDRIEGAFNHVRAEDMSAVRVWVPKKVGQRYGGEREIVGVGSSVELNHYDVCRVIGVTDKVTRAEESRSLETDGCLKL